jgi:drug/metabolite transporter (DMT)-like permease
MKRNNWLWGGLLIVAGVLLLAQNFDLFGATEDVVWAAMFALGSAMFLSVAVRYRRHWWAFIPGMVLLSLATIIGLQASVPRSAGAWGGPIMLGGIGLAFWLIYATQRQHWWAIIPGGGLWTLATVAGMESIWAHPDGGGCFSRG